MILYIPPFCKGFVSGGGRDLRRSNRKIINMITQRHEQVKEQTTAAVEHLKLHGTTTLERLSPADDERKIMGPELGVGVGSVRVGVSGGGQDGAGHYSALCIYGGDCVSSTVHTIRSKETERHWWRKMSRLTKTLLPQCNPLQLFQPIFLPRAVKQRILQHLTIN